MDEERDRPEPKPKPIPREVVFAKSLLLNSNLLRRRIVKQNKNIDGRPLPQDRPPQCEVRLTWWISAEH